MIKLRRRTKEQEEPQWQEQEEQEEPRCSLYGAWKRSKRRDAQECKDIEYNSERCI